MGTELDLAQPQLVINISPNFEPQTMEIIKDDIKMSVKKNHPFSAKRECLRYANIYHALTFIILLARALALQLFAIWWSTGNNISGPLFSPFFFLFSLLSTFLIEGVLQSKNLFSKSRSERPITQSRPLSRPQQQFWGPLVAIFDIAGGAALQAVSDCPFLR